MVGFLQRRSCAAAQPIQYPADYIIFGTRYIGRNPSGGYVIGNLSLQGETPYQDIENTIGYERRSAIVQARTSPQNDFAVITSAQYDDNPVILTDAVTAQQYSVNRLHASGLSVGLPLGIINGVQQPALIRTFYGMSASFRSGVGSTHSTRTDTHIFDGMAPSAQAFAKRVAVTRDIARRVGTAPPFTYTRLSSVATGNVDRDSYRRLVGSVTRIISEIDSSTGASWRWLVKPYTGTLSDGQYHRSAASNGQIVPATGQLLPTLEIRTQVMEIYDPLLATVLENVGTTFTRAANVDNSASYTEVALNPANGNNYFLSRDDTGPSTEPMWSLYGGAVRINWKLEVAVDGGPWFVPMDRRSPSSPQPFIRTLGDRWVRDLAQYPRPYTKGYTVPLAP